MMVLYIIKGLLVLVKAALLLSLYYPVLLIGMAEDRIGALLKRP